MVRPKIVHSSELSCRYWTAATPYPSSERPPCFSAVVSMAEYGSVSMCSTGHKQRVTSSRRRTRLVHYSALVRGPTHHGKMMYLQLINTALARHRWTPAEDGPADGSCVCASEIQQTCRAYRTIEPSCLGFANPIDKPLSFLQFWIDVI